MQRDPFVSVVLPTYNRAACIARAIQSVLAQTHANLELIVVDDASTDSTAEVVARFQDARLRVLRNTERLGVSRARNIGIEAARGQLVAFQDSDDESRLQRIEKQLTVAQAHERAALILCGDVVINDYSMSYLGVNSPENVLDVSKLVPVRIPGASCWLVRRDMFMDAGGFDPKLDCFEDWELALRLLEQGSVFLVNEPLVMRQKTPGSLFSSEPNFSRNLKLILEKHAGQLRKNKAVWASYCNLIGQSECQYGSSREGRRWFIKAAQSYPWIMRTWLNFFISLLGSSLFRQYVHMGRAVRTRLAPRVRENMP